MVKTTVWSDSTFAPDQLDTYLFAVPYLSWVAWKDQLRRLSRTQDSATRRRILDCMDALSLFNTAMASPRLYGIVADYLDQLKDGAADDAQFTDDDMASSTASSDYRSTSETFSILSSICNRI